MYSYNPSQYPSGYDDSPNQISARQGKEQMAMELPPEVQQALARYLQGFNAPTPMSATDRIDIVVPPSENKASSYSQTTVEPYLQQAEAFSHSVGITDTPVANGRGVQMSRSYSLPAYSATQLPMNAPTPAQYLGDNFENAQYIPYLS